jgi:ABC-2 type transport system permease protein
MMRSIYLKTLYDRRFFMLGWTLGLAALSALMTSFYPAMRQDGTIDALVANMPEAFRGLIGNLSDLSSFDTYLASQLFDVRVTLIVGIMAIILGLGLSVTDEEKGELRTILSLPISRTKVLIHKWFAMLSILLFTLLGLVGGIYAVLPFISDASIEAEQVLRLSIMTGLIMVTFGTIPFAVGLSTGKRAVATAVSILAIIGSFILSTFGQAVDWLSDYEKLSLLHYFPAVDIVKQGIDITDVLVLVVITMALLAVTAVSFRSRDVA